MICCGPTSCPDPVIWYTCNKFDYKYMEVYTFLLMYSRGSSFDVLVQIECCSNIVHN